MFGSELLAVKAHRKMTFISPVWPFSKPRRCSVDKQKGYDNWLALHLKVSARLLKLGIPPSDMWWQQVRDYILKVKREGRLPCSFPGNWLSGASQSLEGHDHAEIKNWLFFRVISPPKGLGETQREGQGVQNAVLHLVAAQNNGATISKDSYCS